MHCVLVHRYFWPDTPLYASLLRVLADELCSHGHSVTVLTAQPSYTGASGRAAQTETLQSGVAVKRLALLPQTRSGSIRIKAVNALAFALRVTTAGARLGDVDIVMAATTPPIISGCAASFLARRKGAAFVYHNQDIYPDVAIAAGLLRRRWLAALLERIDAATQRRATRVVVLSQDMRRTIENRGVPRSKIAIINNFDPFTGGHLSATRRDDASQPLNVVFAGNIGRFQGLDAVIAAAAQLQESPVVFHFIGDGAERLRLERRATHLGLSKVRFHGYLSPRALEQFLRDNGDVGIVSLIHGVVNAAYPSKTFSYLSQGCPVLALVEPDTDLATTLRTEGVGFSCEPGDVAGLVSLLRPHIADRSELTAMRERALSFAASELSPRRRLDEWIALFGSLSAPGRLRG